MLLHTNGLSDKTHYVYITLYYVNSSLTLRLLGTPVAHKVSAISMLTTPRFTGWCTLVPINT